MVAGFLVHTVKGITVVTVQLNKIQAIATLTALDSSLREVEWSEVFGPSEIAATLRETIDIVKDALDKDALEVQS